MNAAGVCCSACDDPLGEITTDAVYVEPDGEEHPVILCDLCSAAAARGGADVRALVRQLDRRFANAQQ